MQNNQLVSELKALICDKADGLTAERQKLVYKGITMQDTSLLSDYNLEDGCKVHLILLGSAQGNQNPLASTQSIATSSLSPLTSSFPASQTKLGQTETLIRNQSRFEIMLRDRLNKYFGNDAVERIMMKLQREIDVDINTASLDDLERLAAAKLNISNE